MASEDLKKTNAYIDLVEFNKNNSVGQTSTSNEAGPEIRDTKEVGDTSPVVSDKYSPGEKSNETKEDSEKGEEEECSNVRHTCVLL